MAAIITDDFRRNQAALLVNDIIASAEGAFDSPGATYGTTYHRDNSIYAIGIGKSNPWPNDANGLTEDASGFIVDIPQGTQQENDDVIRNLISLKEVGSTGAARLIHNNAWTTGRKYKAYDPTDNDVFYKTGDLYPCYVTNSDKVYLCLSNTALSSFSSTPTSTETPNTTDTYGFERKTDGYVWAHVANVTASGSGVGKFNTAQFAPILKDADVSPAITSTQENYTGGLLSYIGVSNGGTGYTSAPTVTLTLNGDTDNSTGGGGVVSHQHLIQAKAILDGNTVTRIELQDLGSSNTGSLDYWNTSGNIIKNVRSASIKITGGGGSGATAFARIAPHRGYAKSAIDILPTWFVGVNADFENTEGGDAPTALKFRQISLVKNFKRVNDSDGTTDSYDALKYVTVTGAVSAKLNALAPGDIIKQTKHDDSPVTDVLAYFNHWDSSTNKIYYHQNSEADINTIQFDVGTNDLKVESAAGSPAQNDILATAITDVSTGEFSALDSPTTEEFNGEIIFHENRRPFTRAANQTEEVKLIIQL